MSEEKDEFIPVTWVAIVAIFAAGFLVSQGIDELRDGHSAAGEFFLAVMFLLWARRDAKGTISNGTYRRGWFLWRRDASHS